MQDNTIIEFPKPLKWVSHIISWVFHPVFIPLYVMYFLTFIHPSFFSGFGPKAKSMVILIVTLNAVAFPLISVLLMRGLGFIDSIFLRTQRDRIIPYIASGIFFFWTFWVFHNNEQYPQVVTSFFLGIFLTSSAALLANNYFKISMHAMGMGGWLGIFLVIMKTNTMLMTWPIAIAVLLTGIVCTARMIVSDHDGREIVWGLFLGIIFQFLGAVFIL